MNLCHINRSNLFFLRHNVVGLLRQREMKAISMSLTAAVEV